MTDDSPRISVRGSPSVIYPVLSSSVSKYPARKDTELDILPTSCVWQMHIMQLNQLISVYAYRSFEETRIQNELYAIHLVLVKRYVQDLFVVFKPVN